MAEKRGGRHGQASRSEALGSKDPRSRRTPQFAATDADLGDGLALDNAGRVTAQVDDPLYVTTDGRIGLRVSNGLQIAPGSPLSAQLKLGDDSMQIKEKAVVARPRASHVRMDSVETTAKTLEAVVDSELELVKRKGVASGYPSLNSSGYVTELPADAELQALAGLTSAADKGIQFTGSGTAATYDLTAAGKALLDDANATAQRSTLGLGALSVKGTVATADLDNDAVTYAKIQNVSATDKVLGRSTAGAGDVEEISCTAAARSILDDSTVADMRTTLGATGNIASFQVLTSGTGATYTPTSGTTKILVELCGGGGGGGGAANTAANAAAAGGGGGGGYARKFYSSIGSSYTYTVGTGGAGGAAGNNNGTQGVDTTFDNGGTIITAKRGSGGTGSAAGVVPAVVAGGSGGTVSTNGDVNGAGMSGLPGRVWNGTVAESGQGGSGPFGGGGAACITERNGIAGAGKGAGGSGGCSYGTNAKSGGAGSDGIIIVWEFT